MAPITTEMLEDFVAQFSLEEMGDWLRSEPPALRFYQMEPCLCPVASYANAWIEQHYPQAEGITTVNTFSIARNDGMPEEVDLSPGISRFIQAFDAHNFLANPDSASRSELLVFIHEYMAQEKGNVVAGE